MYSSFSGYSIFGANQSYLPLLASSQSLLSLSLNLLVRLNRVFGLFREEDPEPLAWMLIYRWAQSHHLRLVLQTFLQVMGQRGCWTPERLTEIKDTAASSSGELWRRFWSWDWCLVFILRTTTRFQRDSLKNVDLYRVISPSGYFTTLDFCVYEYCLIPWCQVS